MPVPVAHQRGGVRTRSVMVRPRVRPPGALSGGARGGCTESVSRSARWARILSMTSGVSMQAMTRNVRGIVNLTALAVAQVDAVSRPSPG